MKNFIIAYDSVKHRIVIVSKQLFNKHKTTPHS